MYYIIYDSFGKILSKIQYSTEIEAEDFIEITEEQFITLDISRAKLNLESFQFEELPEFDPLYQSYNYETGEVETNLEALEFIIKSRRDRLLSESDWTDTVSAQTRLGETLYNAWQTYRQSLRDIPQQEGYPLNINWPAPPI